MPGPVGQLAQQPQLREPPSRLTVSRDTPSTSAASSSVKPPKKWSSTTCDWRGLIALRFCNASSSATSSSGRSARANASSRPTFMEPPPRLRFRCARATSTRIRRMMRAAIARKCVRFRHCTRLISTEPQIRLVDERGRLQRVIRPLAGHVAPGQLPQLVVHERHELIERGRLSLSPCQQQLGRTPGFHGHSSHSTPPLPDGPVPTARRCPSSRAKYALCDRRSSLATCSFSQTPVFEQISAGDSTDFVPTIPGKTG